MGLLAGCAPQRKRFVIWTLAALLVTVMLCITWVVVDEMQSSRRQAAWLSSLASDLHYAVEPGPSAEVRFPGAGPFDERLGYHRLPERVQRLAGQGFTVAAQSRMSPKMIELIDEDLFAIYREKSQAGLELRDCRRQPLAVSRYPERTYERFESVPPLLVDSLLFIENRELLDPRFPMRNPAVEWDRFGKVLFDQALHRLDPSHSAAGGSTLATQIEKYRHSHEGRTASGKEKLRQMASASLRAYLDGEDTLPRRRQIVVDYLNTVPLSAMTGFGEVNGIGDGLWAFYGRDFAEVNRLLSAAVADDGPMRAKDRALAFKQALSLIVAQRRPSFYLAEGEPVLRQLTDSYLRVMADAGIITPGLRDAALPMDLKLQSQLTVARPGSFVDYKAANAVRGKLQALLAVQHSYDLDRLDLTADTSLDGEVQRAATALLRGLGDPQAAHAAGLYGFRLLNEGDDPGKILFSFTLFERGEHSNLLRVQTDNFDQPFDLNEGARLDLGSTAKLRTLVTYLELVAELHGRWSGLSADQLAALKIGNRDPLSRWVRDHLAQAADKSLAAMLESAMERRFSASPAEGFFTGGGVHHFENFEPEDNHRTVTVREALTRSVNLVFIRLMRDVVQHVMARSEGESAALIDDPSHPLRQDYLARFADKEGREFIARFYRKYAGKSAREADELLVRSARPTPARLAAALYGLEPAADVDRLGEFIERRLPSADLSDAALQALSEKLGPGRWSPADRGYLAGVHPLELWVAAYLREHPEATLGEAVSSSAAQRQEVYQWLFKTRHKGAQDPNIASKKWIYEQYDSMVGAGTTSSNAPSDAAIVLAKPTNKALALTTDCNSRYVFADPYKGAMIAVAEAARNIVCSGGQPLGVTNCLNFGNPYDPEVYYQFSNAIKGMGEACLKFDTPVTGGNVSFYNQSPDGPVYPTPTIGMVGLLDSADDKMTLNFKNEGNSIYLVGQSRNDINSSEYLHKIIGEEYSPCPHFELEEEFRLQQTLISLIKNKLVNSAHDVSEGGLIITLLESAFPDGLGFDVAADDATIRKDAYWFGESQSRVVVSVSAENEKAFAGSLQSAAVPFALLGKVTARPILVDGQDWGSITDWKNKYDNAIGDILIKHESEEALSII